MTLIKEIIDIPERVQKGDYVLKLVEDIKRPDVVLGNYVVTPELAKNFDAALTFIRSALTGRTSKATFLHGSFGTGKSHFMAVLDQILEGNAAARGIRVLSADVRGAKNGHGGGAWRVAGDFGTDRLTGASGRRAVLRTRTVVKRSAACGWASPPQTRARRCQDGAGW